MAMEMWTGATWPFLQQTSAIRIASTDALSISAAVSKFSLTRAYKATGEGKQVCRGPWQNGLSKLAHRGPACHCEAGGGIYYVRSTNSLELHLQEPLEKGGNNYVKAVTYNAGYVGID